MRSNLAGSHARAELWRNSSPFRRKRTKGPERRRFLEAYPPRTSVLNHVGSFPTCSLFLLRHLQLLLSRTPSSPSCCSKNPHVLCSTACAQLVAIPPQSEVTWTAPVMGACSSTEGGRRPEWEPTSQDLAQSKAIDRLLRDDEDKLASEVKVGRLSFASSTSRLTTPRDCRCYCWVGPMVSPLCDYCKKSNSGSMFVQAQGRAVNRQYSYVHPRGQLSGYLRVADLHP